MLSAFVSAFRTPDLRRKILFTLGLIALYRLGAALPSPGVDYQNVQECVKLVSGGESAGIYQLINLFSGGALLQLSVFAIGIMPYITASIIIQLLTVVIPRFEELRKEGQSGQTKMTQYTRYLSVALAVLQATGLVALASRGQLLQGCNEPILADTSIFGMIIIVLVMTAGASLVMWFGEQITERGVGNGISMLIFAGIVAGLPRAIGQSFESARQGDINIFALIGVGLLAVAIIAFVVFIERGQRRIAVHYAKRQQGRKVFAAQTSHLPLKVNMAGVIPAIFASSILLFPASLGSWFGQSEGLGWLQDVAQAIAPGQPLNILLFTAGIVFFCFFYTALMFNPKDVAENLKKSGAFIPGIRPGEQSARYIDGVLTRLTMFGALYMTAVCLLPQFLVVAAHVPFYLGGTSLLIVVVVVMDFMAQVQSHLVSHQYESLMKKANLKGYGSGMLR